MCLEILENSVLQNYGVSCLLSFSLLSFNSMNPIFSNRYLAVHGYLFFNNSCWGKNLSYKINVSVEYVANEFPKRNLAQCCAQRKSTSAIVLVSKAI